MTGKEIIKLIEENELQDMEVKFSAIKKNDIKYFAVAEAMDIGFENDIAIVTLKDAKGEYSE